MFFFLPPSRYSFDTVCIMSMCCVYISVLYTLNYASTTLTAAVRVQRSNSKKKCLSFRFGRLRFTRPSHHVRRPCAIRPVGNNKQIPPGLSVKSEKEINYQRRQLCMFSEILYLIIIIMLCSCGPEEVSLSRDGMFKIVCARARALGGRKSSFLNNHHIFSLRTPL